MLFKLTVKMKCVLPPLEFSRLISDYQQPTCGCSKPEVGIASRSAVDRARGLVNERRMYVQCVCGADISYLHDGEQ